MLIMNSEERIRLALLSDDIGRRSFARIALNEIADCLRAEDTTAAMLAERCQISGTEPSEMALNAIGVVVTRLRVLNDTDTDREAATDSEIQKLVANGLIYLTARAIADGSPATVKPAAIDPVKETEAEDLTKWARQFREDAADSGIMKAAGERAAESVTGEGLTFSESAFCATAANTLTEREAVTLVRDGFYTAAELLEGGELSLKPLPDEPDVENARRVLRDRILSLPGGRNAGPGSFVPSPANEAGFDDKPPAEFVAEHQNEPAAVNLHEATEAVAEKCLREFTHDCANGEPNELTVAKIARLISTGGDFSDEEIRDAIIEANRIRLSNFDNGLTDDGSALKNAALNYSIGTIIAGRQKATRGERTDKTIRGL